VSTDRRERFLAVDMGKETIAGKARRCEPHNTADSLKNFGHLEASCLMELGCFGYSHAGNESSGLWRLHGALNFVRKFVQMLG